MKRTILSLFGIIVLAGVVATPAHADYHHRHCYYRHHHRVCR